MTNRTIEDIKKLCDTIRETSFSIHSYFRSGYLEKIYVRSLVIIPAMVNCNNTVIARREERTTKQSPKGICAEEITLSLHSS